MNMAKKVLLTAVVLPLTMAASGAFAAGGPQGPKGDRTPDGVCGPDGEQSILQQLNLSKQQTEQLKALHQKEHQAMRKEMKALHDEEQSIVLAKNFDQEKATQLAQKMVNLQVQRRVEMLQQRHDMMAILTPEQKGQFELLQKYRMSQCMKGPGMKGHGPKGRPDGEHGPRGEMPMPEQP